jgi:predicted metal-binding transcription factor (methanogenesis marker protein 9)
MTKEEKLFNEICERCENHATNFTCEDMKTCPAFRLFEIAKGKTKTVYKKKSSWEEDTTPRNSECLGGVAHASVTY